jgi:hypothetical protein
MMHKLALVMLIVLALLASPAPALAQGGCPPNGATADMAGVYVSPESQMRVTVLPCSYVHVRWQNAYGEHEAYYAATQRVDTGGIIGRIVSGDVGLDARQTIGVKPAEPGYVQVFTISPYGTDLQIYRLSKVE